MLTTRRGVLLLVACAAVVLGCAPVFPTTSGVKLPSAPAELARCKVAASGSSPLVTEWPASEKANLEALLGAGGVAVAYSGCSMRVLPQCRLRGGYHWLRTTPATDVIEIKDEDELYTKLPLGAASLEGELKRSGQLSVRTTVSGQMKLDGLTSADVPADGDCAGATHIVSALTVGAFALEAGGATTGKASAGVTGIVDAGLSSDRSKKLVRSAGTADSCGEGTAEAAPANCRSPIQVFLAPLPGRAAEEGPPGTVKVDFVSGSATDRWDVYANDAVICTTPCSKWVEPLRPVMLRTRADGWFFMPSSKVTVPRFDGPGPLRLEAHDTSNGMFMAGMTVGGFGVMAMMMGGMMAALTCGDSDGAFRDHCTPAIVILGIGLPVALVGTWMLVSSLPHAEVKGLDQAARRPPPARRLVLGPGFVVGRF